MTPMEQLQEEKKSGLYQEPTATTEACPVEKPEAAPSPTPPRVSQASFVVPKPLTEPEKHVKSIYSWLLDNEKVLAYNTKKLNLIYWLVLATFLSICIAIGIILLQKNNTKEVAKIQYKTKVLEKKILVASGDDKWRRRMCYEKGDFKACLAYKKGIPLRARIGRMDLR